MARAPVPDLIRRKQATDLTLAKFRGKGWSWESGITCVHLMRFHLLKMGHAMPPMPRLRSLLTAKRELALRGCANVAELMDQLGVPQIPPAMMLMGDIAALPGGEDGIGALLVCLGPHKLMGWREDYAELIVLDVEFSDISTAWSC